MRLGLFHELQHARPWADGADGALLHHALDQLEAADALGFHEAWFVEHHFLEEYSHCSAPEVVLAAASQRTRRMRMGHGVRLMPPGYVHPARVAEAVATLDLLSGGRVDWGTGVGASRAELEGFGVPPAERHAHWEEAVRECARMMSMTPYPGHQGRSFNMPARNVLPKPQQAPHPPLWMACSQRDTVRIAARHGMGALCFATVTPDEAREWVEEYHRIFATEGVPLGLVPNPQVAMVIGFGCHASPSEAQRRFLEGLAFHDFGLTWFYRVGVHRPGATSLFDAFQATQRMTPRKPGPEGPAHVGTPTQLGRLYARYEEAGVDQLILNHAPGITRQEHIMEALELCGRQVLPAFHDRHDARAASVAAARRPAVDAAMERKARLEKDRPAPLRAPAIEAYPLANDPQLRAVMRALTGERD